jgi:hypothetical protein
MTTIGQLEQLRKDSIIRRRISLSRKVFNEPRQVMVPDNIMVGKNSPYQA